MQIISRVKRSFNTFSWVITSPIEVSFFIWAMIWEVLRFPLLWVNVLGRTAIFGAFVASANLKYQALFKKLVGSGRGIIDQPFSTSHPGAKLDILIPAELYDAIQKDGNKQGKKYPVIIMYSGGAWILGKKLWLWPLLVNYADAGFIAIAADYRQWPFGSMKDMIQDALDSVSWVFDQIEKPCSFLEFADADQVIVLGQSAGAHIASLSLLELARVRKEQMKLVAQGVEGCEKPYLHSKNKGVPLALVAVGGMFDLASTVENLHKRGLHRKILESLCEKEPLAKYCAKTRATEAAKEARTELLYGASSSSVSPKLKKSPAMPVVDEMAKIVNNNDGDDSSSSQKNSSQKQQHQQQQQQQQQQKKISMKSNKNFARKSGEFCDAEISPIDPLETTTKPKNELCSPPSQLNQQEQQQTNSTDKNINKPIIVSLLKKRAPTATVVDLQTAKDEILKRIEAVSSVNFLPRFNLFVHGDRDISAPLDQAISTMASFNDAAARHAHELVGEDIIYERRQPSFGTREPFYILSPKPRTVSPAHSRQHSRTFSNSPATSEIVDLDNNNNKQQQTSSSSSSSFQGLCDCYAGSRAVFLSYERSTHTTLIVDDFMIADTNPPLVVCVKALLATLLELEFQHALIPMVPSPQLSSAFEKEENKKHHRSISSSSCFTPSLPPLMAKCSKCSLQLRSQPEGEQQQQNTSDGLNKPSFDDDNNNNNSSGINDDENPYDYLCAPQSIATPLDLFISTFEQHYQKFDKMDLRVPDRPVISAAGRWLCDKVTAF